MTDVWREFKFATYLAFRTIVPEEKDRIPLTWSNGIYPILCYVPFVFLAYLSRQPDTYIIRVLLLPTTITAILVAAYRFTWTIPEINVYNWGQCLWAAVAIGKSLEFALTKEGMLKIGESRPGVKKGKSKSDETSSTEDEHNRHPYIATWLYDAVDVIHTLRGLQWKFGRGVYIPKPTRPLERSAFLRATLRSFIKNYLLLDFLESALKLFPGMGTPMGGSIFYPDLTVPTRYIVSTVLGIITGWAIMSGFYMVYDLVTLIAVGLFGGSPTSWPPVMERPWHSDSMHRFWSKDWHQLLRQTFIVFGGYPGKWIAGRMGMIFGTFIASGMYHECAMYSMDRGFDRNPIIFFGSQGFVLLIERAWKRTTGRPVSGPWGRLWVYFIMLVCAQPTVNSWHRRGLGGAMVIPPIISPTRQFLLPLVRKLLNGKQY
ncbi:hypothetical protein BDN70DRAFT_870654 [Pholiota conissans]|uniref:Wax synthase domain-containing protein n=1 Tax=Pholiota conissans TaxID=109636 RepID=A0A9P5ZCY1_9AGAR|nr:hypothetical protein BDN70DRAFT_870654 [Pholiota conissans]